MSAMEETTSALLAATEVLKRAVAVIERTATAQHADGNEWKRMIQTGKRCPISGWSPSKIRRELSPKKGIKKVGGCTYYNIKMVKESVQ